jgi:hypothetical protein
VVNRASVITIFLLAACAKKPDLPNCAVAPTGFFSWRSAPYNIDQYYRNVISISNGPLAFNGASLGGTIDTSDTFILDQYLGESARLNPVPVTAITFRKGVACYRVTAVRTLMEKHLSCRANIGKCVQGAPPGQSD